MKWTKSSEMELPALGSVRRCYSSQQRREIVAVNEYVIWLMHFVTRCVRTKRTEANLSFLHFNVNALRTGLNTIGLNEKFRKLDELLKFNSWRLDCEIETLAFVCPQSLVAADHDERSRVCETHRMQHVHRRRICDFMKSDWKLIMSSFLLLFCFDKSPFAVMRSGFCRSTICSTEVFAGTPKKPSETNEMKNNKSVLIDVNFEWDLFA